MTKRYSPKPKKSATRADVAKAALGWGSFPEENRPDLVEAVTAAIEAYHKLAVPERYDIEALDKANLARPNRPGKGRPQNAVVDHLVSLLANIFGRFTGETPTRSWSLADASDFESMVADVFRIAGIGGSSAAAVQRHIHDRNLLPDESDSEALKFGKEWQ